MWDDEIFSLQIYWSIVYVQWNESIWSITWWIFIIIYSHIATPMSWYRKVLSRILVFLCLSPLAIRLKQPLICCHYSSVFSGISRKWNCTSWGLLVWLLLFIVLHVLVKCSFVSFHWLKTMAQPKSWELCFIQWTHWGLQPRR